MYTCTLPPEHSLSNLDRSFECLPRIDPNVVFLNAETLRALLDDEAPFAANRTRLARVDQMLDNGLLVLPIITISVDRPRIYDGRHRTAAMWMRGEMAVPFLTDATMTAALKHFLGGRFDITKFDLSNIPYPIA